jgi:hypothetical protein
MLHKGSIFSANRDTNGAPPPIGRVVSSTNIPSASSGGSPMAQPARPPESAPVTEPPGAKLVVGPGVKLKGAEIQDCDTLMVEERV